MLIYKSALYWLLEIQATFSYMPIFVCADELHFTEFVVNLQIL